MASSQAFYDGLMSFESTSTGWCNVFCFLCFFASRLVFFSHQRLGGPLGGLVTVLCTLTSLTLGLRNGFRGAFLWKPNSHNNCSYRRFPLMCPGQKLAGGFGVINRIALSAFLLSFVWPILRGFLLSCHLLCVFVYEGVLPWSSSLMSCWERGG